MVAGVLLRNYKNYGNLNFIPICDDSTNMFSIYVGNNGVGKSAILEAIDVFFNNRQWNVTVGMKKSEAYVCPLFLIPKADIPSYKKHAFEIVSDYFWTDKCESNANVKTVPALKEFIAYREKLKSKYEKSHYLILIGVSCESGHDAFFGTFNKGILDLFSPDSEENGKKLANQLRDEILNLYSYLYIPVEESPSELLQLQNETMQKLLNKDIQQEIEKILTRKEDGSTGATIVKRINENLDAFINEINDVISSIDVNYSFAPSIEAGNKKNLTAKDIRTKIIEAYFPLRSLKVRNRRVELLSSGEQRKAVIDIAYSTLVANKSRKTEKKIILAIDEPESSMHISNCFDQFLRLAELTQGEIHKQVLLTTHWYGFLPIAQNGNMHHLMVDFKTNQTTIKSFGLSNVLEQRKNYPDDVELKSMFDLASSMITYMRQHTDKKWIVCEGSDDKVYLETVLAGYEPISILPVGGCGNVVKLYQMLYGFMTEKIGDDVANVKALFLIDTDLQMLKVRDPFDYSREKPNAALRRLQLVNGIINLTDPRAYTTYSQTEMEDCLDPQVYWNAVTAVICESKESAAKRALKNLDFVNEAKVSLLRGDESCICPKESKHLKDKKVIIEFAENDKNKYLIAFKYADLCKGKTIHHALADLIANELNLQKIENDH